MKAGPETAGVTADKAEWIAGEALAVATKADEVEAMVVEDLVVAKVATMADEVEAMVEEGLMATTVGMVAVKVGER